MRNSIKNRFLLVMVGLLALLLVSVGGAMYLWAEIGESTTHLQENMDRLSKKYDQSLKSLHQRESLHHKIGDVKGIQLLEERYRRTRKPEMLEAIITKLFTIEQWIVLSMEEEASPRNLSGYRVLQAELTKYRDMIGLVLEHPDSVVEDDEQPADGRVVVRISELQQQSETIRAEMEYFDNIARERIVFLREGIVEMQANTEIMRDRIKAGTQKQSFIMWGVIAIFVVVSVFAGISVQKMLFSPISALMTFTQRISAGEYGITCTPPNSTEMGQMGDTINEMSLRIKHDIAEHKRAEEELKENAHYIDTLGDALYVMDVEGRMLKANKAASKLSGYTEQELLGMKHSELVPQEAMEKHLVEMKKLIERGTAGSIESDILTKEGKKIPVIISGSVIKDSRGLPEVFIAVIKDITELKQVEERLKAGEERFRSLTASSPIAMFQTDMQGRVTYTNPKWQALSGQSFEVSLGEGWQNAVHPEDRRELLDVWLGAAREGREFSMEHRIITEQGDLRWTHSRAAVMRSDNGALIGYVGTVEDITERKKADEALHQSKKDLQEYIDAMATLNGKTSPDGTILTANKVAVELSGLSIDELIGQPFWSAPWWSYDPDVQERLREAITKAASGSTILYDEKICVGEDNFLITNISLMPVFDDEGRVKYIIAEGRDISDLKQIENELRLAMEKAESASLDLAENVEELERFNRLAVGREKKMIQMKQQVNTLSRELGREAVYDPAVPGENEMAGDPKH